MITIDNLPLEIYSRVMTLREFKVFLGPKLAAGYTDPQLLQLQRDMREAVALLLQLWLDRRAARKAL